MFPPPQSLLFPSMYNIPTFFFFCNRCVKNVYRITKGIVTGTVASPLRVYRFQRRLCLLNIVGFDLIVLAIGWKLILAWGQWTCLCWTECWLQQFVCFFLEIVQTRTDCDICANSIVIRCSRHSSWVEHVIVVSSGAWIDRVLWTFEVLCGVVGGAWKVWCLVECFFGLKWCLPFCFRCWFAFCTKVILFVANILWYLDYSWTF